ncbi:hypothetical protein AB0C28_41785 [Nonomuraea sp. NPDC048892]|uniref:hypothetical protein n=1 Tax=Nonomuraea sp. NPDC048892 TaxID=3154624 RepID=UPI00340AF3B4
MTGERLVADVMSDRFTVCEPHAERPEKGFAVVIGADGSTVGLLGPDGPGPAFVVAADATVMSLLDWPELLEWLRHGLPAAVAERDGRPVGVVTARIMAAEIARAARRRGSRLLTGDYAPYGQAAPAGEARVFCATCGSANIYTRFSKAKAYRCRGGHQLDPVWPG